MTLMQLDALVSVEAEATVTEPEAAPGDAQSLISLAAMAGRR